MKRLKKLYKSLCDSKILTDAQIEEIDKIMQKENLVFDALLCDGSIELIDANRSGLLIYVERDGTISRT